MSAKCCFCEKEMLLLGDFSFEDYGLEGEGLVLMFKCPNCEATAEFYSKINLEK